MLTFQGQPGTIYTATSSHIPIFAVRDPPETGQPTYYEDYYNYSSFEQGGDITYPNSYVWYGPGPDMQERKNNAHVGNTTKSGAIAPTISLAFTGSKPASDSLLFSAGGVCSEILGPLTCTDYFRYSYGGQATVKRASNWIISQTLVSGRTKGLYRSGGAFNTLYPTATDGPAAAFTQATNGYNLFWIDSPGTPTGVGGDPVDSLTSVNNFSVAICSTVGTRVCGSYQWYTELVVSPGAQHTTGTAGQGSISTIF